MWILAVVSLLYGAGEVLLAVSWGFLSAGGIGAIRRGVVTGGVVAN